MAILRAGHAVAPTRSARLKLHGSMTADELAAALHIALASAPPSLAPSADFPPHVTPELWASSCKGGEHRRCGECALCLWERDAQLWSHVRPWNRELRADNDNEPRFRSIDGALLELVQHTLTGRDLSSTLGKALDRLQAGDRGTLQRQPHTMPRTVARGLDLVHVQVALERAYDDATLLAPADCARVLLARVAGVLAGVTSFEQLSKDYAVSESTLQTIVREGRKRIGAELVERGLLRPSLGRARHASLDRTTCDIVGNVERVVLMENCSDVL